MFLCLPFCGASALIDRSRRRCGWEATWPAPGEIWRDEPPCWYLWEDLKYKILLQMYSQINFLLIMVVVHEKGRLVKHTSN